jgi:hypothetical protein
MDHLRIEKTTAARLPITLHSVPPGRTDEFQPLDRADFAFWGARFHANPYWRGTKQEAVADTTAARRAVIENARDICIQ